MKYLFIHGWSFSKDIWRNFYSVENSIYIDLPFHNGNINYKKENILENFSLEVAQLIKDLKDDICIIGWSLGATVSVLTGLIKPKNLKKLVLVGFSPKFKDEKLGHSPKNIKAFILQLRKDFIKTVYQFRKTAVDNKFLDIPLPEKNGSIKLLKEFIDLDLTESIGNLDIETILIHGKKDKIINFEGSIFANNFIKNSKLILVEDNHAPFLNKPELILQNLK